MVWQTKKIVRVKDLGEKQEVKTNSKTEEPKGVGLEEIKSFYDEKTSRLEKPASGIRIWMFVLFFIAALVGGFMANFFILTQESIKIPFVGEIRLKEFFPTRELTLVTEKNITVTSDLRLSDLSTRLKSQIMNIYETKEKKEGDNIFDQVYLTKEAISQAGVLTSDGWLMSASDLGDGNKYVAVSNENKIFAIEKIVKDPLTGLNFLKVEAKNLPVINFMSGEEKIIQGEQVFSFDHSDNLFTDIVSSSSGSRINKKEDLIRSTDYFSEELILEKDYSKGEFLGSFIFGLDGLCLGIKTKERIVPYPQFERAIKSILEKKEISRNYLGLKYLRIEELAGQEFKDAEKGVIIYGDPEKSSPAEASGIKSGDVITRVDSTPLGEGVNLTEIVQKKKAGEEIRLFILRDGQETEVKVNIRSQK